jgi:hypothetical protein
MQLIVLGDTSDLVLIGLWMTGTRAADGLN